MIAVVGAGGATGLECVRGFQSSGTKVRAVVRNLEKYEGKFGTSEVVKGDVTDEESLKEAFKGCTGVVFAASASKYCGKAGPRGVDYEGVEKTARAAAAAGVGRVVLVSSRLVNPKQRFHPIRAILNNIKYSLMDRKFLGEEALRKSGIEYTIIRPGGLTGGEGDKRGTTTQPGTEYVLAAVAEGDLGKARSIHRTDVASVVCEAMKSPDAVNKTIEIVARPRTEQDPSFADRLQEICKGIPVDA
jgi:uncharacterized protein YbjT (DUF2867 family)